jgi:hypothetical protein
MPKKGGKKTIMRQQQRVKQKVIVNVNTGRSSRRPSTTSTQRPISSGSGAPVVILQPQPQIKPQQQQLQPQAQSQQVEELNRRLQSQQDQFSQQTKNLEDIINKQKQTLEEAQIEPDRKTAVLSQAQLDRRERERRIAEEKLIAEGKKSSEASSSSSSSTPITSSGRDRSRSTTAEGKRTGLVFPSIEETMEEFNREMGGGWTIPEKTETAPAPKKEHKKK